MPLAYLSLGSNLGQSTQNLSTARSALNQDPELTIIATSQVYWTEPQLKRDQAWFANQVISIQTNLDPVQLLQKLLSLEVKLGRIRSERYGPRIIDLDLLLYDQEILDTPFLSLPHPQLTQRAFVLIPLLEIAPHLTLPDQTSLTSLLQKLDYQVQANKIYQN